MANTSNDRQRRFTLGILLGAWLIIVVPLAEAQEVDSRWVPWIGCWQAVDETAAAPLLCVVPLTGEAAVEMLTIVDGQVVARESIFTDGQQHAVSREECEGWESAEFSGDSRRIYVRTELTCGAGESRSSTGVMSWVSPFEWLEVRTMEVDGQNVPWSLRYRLASQADFQAAGQGDLISVQGGEARRARMAASVPLTLADVIDATENLSGETVQVWVVERGEPFRLDASGLIEMADAGVPAGVIDVVVAVSYPERFVVNDGATLERRPAEGARGRRSVGFGRSLNPFDDPFYDPYSRYGYYSPYRSRLDYGLGYYGGYGYGYGGYGYGYGGFGLGGYNYGYNGYGVPIIVVGRRSSGNDSGPAEGRVRRGGGYTSVGASSGSTGRSARTRSSGAAARSGGSSAAPSPRGSSGSSGSSTGRSAQPRNPGLQ